MFGPTKLVEVGFSDSGDEAVFVVISVVAVANAQRAYVIVDTSLPPEVASASNTL